MTFSDLLPIQFWPFVLRSAGAAQTLRVLFNPATGTFSNRFGYGNSNTPVTFNELQNQPGIMAVPYFAPLDFADDIVIQFLATAGGTYKLNMIRDDGHGFIFNQSFTEMAAGVYQISIAGSSQLKNIWGKYQFSIASTANLLTSNIMPAISTGTNQADGGEDWTIGATATITLEGSTSPTSNRIMFAFTDTTASRTYVCNISGTATQAAGSDVRGYIEFKFYSNGAEVTSFKRRYAIEFNKNQNIGSSTACTFACKLILPANQAQSFDAVSVQAVITDFDASADADPDLDVVISSASIAEYGDNMIIYAKSDHHDCYWAQWDELNDNSIYDDISTNWPVGRSSRQTVLIKYTNTDTYENVNFDTSPGPFFNLRIPATFFHEAFAKQQEVHKLSTGRFITVWGELVKKRKLEVSHVPYYIHRKIQLALSCDSVNVGSMEHLSFTNYDSIEANQGIDVVVQDEYLIEEGNRRYPLKKATVLLTDKEYIRRNLI